MISSINHISFTVADLDKAIDFYSNVLGLKCISIAERDEEFSSSVTGINGAKMKIAYYECSNCKIELIQYIGAPGVKLDTNLNNVGSSHLCFCITNFDEWLLKMKNASVKFRGEVCVVTAGPNKGKRILYMMDPDGNNLELIEEIQN